MSQSDQYGVEVAVARDALGSPREAAAAWRSGCFQDRMISDVGPAILAACLVWDDRLHRWSDDAALIALACKSLAVAGAWIDDDLRIIGEGDWLSPLWGMGHVSYGVYAMRDPRSSSSAWMASLSAWRSLFGSEAA